MTKKKKEKETENKISLNQFLNRTHSADFPGKLVPFLCYQRGIHQEFLSIYFRCSTKTQVS